MLVGAGDGDDVAVHPTPCEDGQHRHAAPEHEELRDVGPDHRAHPAVVGVGGADAARHEHGERDGDASHRLQRERRRVQRLAEVEVDADDEEEAADEPHAQVEAQLQVLVRRGEAKAVEEWYEYPRGDGGRGVRGERLHEDDGAVGVDVAGVAEHGDAGVERGVDGEPDGAAADGAPSHCAQHPTTSPITPASRPAAATHPSVHPQKKCVGDNSLK